MNVISGFRYSLASGLAITFLSLVPQRHLPESDFDYADIAIHVLMYAVWMVLVITDLKRHRERPSRKLILRIALILLIYSGILEIIQESVVEGRHGSIADFVANAAGIFLGSLVYGKERRQAGQ